MHCGLDTLRTNVWSGNWLSFVFVLHDIVVVLLAHHLLWVACLQSHPRLAIHPTQMFVRTLSGKTVLMPPPSDGDLSTLRQNIAEVEGIPPEMQVGLFNYFILLCL